MSHPNRRQFLTQAAATATFVNLNPRAMGANERVNLALIGGRNQGRGVALRAIQQGGEFKTFCDLDEEILRKTGADLNTAQKKMPGFEKDFRRVYDDKDIDAVIIGLPDHWHAIAMIQACQAGKDVYCEKPLSQTIAEGHLMREAARKYNRVVQVGTQRRSSEHFQSAVEYVASGKLGKVCLIKAWINQVRQSIGRPPDGTPPPGIDYDRWLGPAPNRAFNPNRFHYNWRFFWDYGNTELGNQGVHVLDVAVWAIQKMHGFENFNCLPKRISATGGIYWLDDAKEVPDAEVVTYDYGHTLLNFELRSFQNDQLRVEETQVMRRAGTDFYTAYYGTEGTLLAGLSGWEVHGKDGKLEKVVKDSGGSHERNFLDCVKSRNKPNSDIEIGRLSTTMCHLGNISYKLGRDVHFDPHTETFPGDKQANALIEKEYRKPYVLPKI